MNYGSNYIDFYQFFFASLSFFKTEAIIKKYILKQVINEVDKVIIFF